MKPEIHPPYHEITVIMTDGTEYKTRTTWGKQGDTMRLEIDPKTHPAWTGQHRILDRGGQLAKFNKRFSGIGAKGDVANDAPQAAAAPAAEAAPAESKIKLTTTGTKKKK